MINHSTNNGEFLVRAANYATTGEPIAILLQGDGGAWCALSIARCESQGPDAGYISGSDRATEKQRCQRDDEGFLHCSPPVVGQR
jgi:hypothetical protein